MNLPIVESTQLTKQIDLALAYALFQRERHGKKLQQVVLPPEIKRGYLGVSSISTPPCALYYSLTNEPKEETDTSSRFGFDTGHVLESYVLDLLRVEDRQGELSWPYLLAPGGVIKGHYDGKTNGLAQDGDCIVEVKATGGYSFNKKIEEGADAGHVEQAFIYAAGSASPYFTLIYCNREAKKSTPFYTVFAYHIPDMEAAQKTVQTLFAERFDPVLLSLHHELRPDAPAVPRWEFGKRGWRCRPDSSYFTKGGKENFTVGYCSYRPTCPEAVAYRQIEEEKKQAQA
jgi:hypothetical protein